MCLGVPLPIQACATQVGAYLLGLRDHAGLVVSTGIDGWVWRGCIFKKRVVIFKPILSL